VREHSGFRSAFAMTAGEETVSAIRVVPLAAVVGCVLGLQLPH
jgi:hypothetical protein